MAQPPCVSFHLFGHSGHDQPVVVELIVKHLGGARGEQESVQPLPFDKVLVQVARQLAQLEPQLFE